MLKWTKQQQQIQSHIQQQQLQHRNRKYRRKSLNLLPSPKSREYFENHCKTARKSLQPTTKTFEEMPTMTHTLERRLHRRSLDNQLDGGGRHSLTSQANKENFGVHFMRSSAANTSLSALHDISNGKSPQRPSSSLQPARNGTPLSIKQLNSNNDTTSSRRRRAGRFSDDFVDANDASPLSRMRFRQALRDESSLSSSRMGDTTLDRMLDAIIESARKDAKIEQKQETKYLQQQTERPPSRSTGSLHGDSDFEASIHEMEVRTPTHLKRQRVVRRKKNVGTTSKQDTAKRQQKQMAPKSLLTPQTKNEASVRTKALLTMDTPQHTPCAVRVDPPIFGKELQRCSTPTLQETQSIKRCLSFSPPSDEDVVDDADYSAAKRSSVASSNASSMCDHPQLSAIDSHRSSWKLVGGVKGSLDLAIYVAQEQLNVQVIRCRDLQRSNGSTTLNAYVKVALIRRPEPSMLGEGKAADHGFQRTAVHRHSNRPYFDHHFKFDLSQRETVTAAAATLCQGDEDRLQLAVWHRDRQLKRSEFLGCISFPLQLLLRQPVSGSFRLQSQACLNNPQPAVLATTTTSTTTTTTTSAAQNITHQATHPQLPTGASYLKPFNMATLARQKGSSSNTANITNTIANINNNNNVNNNNNDDEAISIDSMALPPPPDARHQPISLSKKAIHQRDADENLFLRFLELDPPTEVAAAASSSAAGTQLSSTAAAVSSSARRHSFGKQVGRTPFTMTKKLTRTAERGFGFSIVWTHPPRVEKIEPGLSADRSGILPGDYVIFVDKHNVVTMPEADVLNLIRSQGATLTLEIFRRSGSGGAPVPPALSATTRSTARSLATAITGGTTLLMNGKAPRVNSVASNCTNADEGSLVAATATAAMRTPGISGVGGGSGGGGGGGGGVIRPSTACSGTSSIEAAKRRLNLPQVTFSKESIAPITDNRRRFLLQLISREQNFISALHFGMQRFVQPLQERKDLISPNDHRTLFQNIDELQRISEDILEQLCNDDQEPQMNFASRVYLSKTTAICAAYKKYCNGIKRADCVLVNKSRQSGSEFIAFITEPQVPRKRPDVCMLIHRPLQHFREILKLMQLLASNCHVDSEEHKNFSSVINELQAAYREITVTSGLMEPLGEGRPLLTLQDLESRMVFTKCKPFTLAVQGRQWIFGGDLSRVEGRSVKPYWTLLFSDIIVFAKVSRDRVLFITEEPIPIANVVDSCFHMRKKTTEFRLTVDPNGRLAESPTGYCAPDLSRTPKKSARRKSLVLRAPSLELKAVWQNLLQRQIFLVNAALGSTPLSSPLDSPDVLNTLVPLSDIGVASASIGSTKLSSMDSINQKNQQQSKQQRHSLSHPTDQIELLIDEKCRILNKTGTPKSSALHLANWMKGQLDKQQEQARLAAERSRAHIAREDEHLLYSDSDHDERITYWTRQQLEKRTLELNLIKENGKLRAKPDFGGKRLSGVEELSMSDAYSENVSQLSQSRSTTSDSQITVRSSPNVLDKLAVCHHCHKHCQQSMSQQTQPLTSSTSPPRLLCNSLKVQHSQSSSHRCCRLTGGASNVSSSTSISSSTVTGEQNSEHSSSKLVDKVGDKIEAGGCDTENSVAARLTDEISLISHSDATDSNNALDIGKSTGPRKGEGTAEANNESGDGQRERSLRNSFNNIRVLDQAQPKTQQAQRDPSATTDTGLSNGHISSGTSSLSGSGERIKPEPPPRRLKITPQTAATNITTEQRVRTTVIKTETAQVVHNKSVESNHPKTIPKSPKSPKSPQPKAANKSPTKYTACSCDCTPADFEHTTLSPDELEQQTCKLLDSPKQSPRILARQFKLAEDPHKYCKCVCGKAEAISSVSRAPGEHRESPKQTKSPTTKPSSGHDANADEDGDLSLMLLGLAQFTPAAKLLQMNRRSMTPGKQASSALSPKTSPILRAPATTPAEAASALDAFVPTIAVVPPTPDALLTKTTTNIWDNSSHQAIQLLISNAPRRPAVEHIPDDSGDDESPGDEEPPYRPMNKSLRRYGTMSSLEKLPSDDRMDDGEVEELEDDGNFVDNMKGSNLSVEKTHDALAEDYDDDDDDDNDDDDNDDDDDEENEFNDDELEDELREELEAEFEGDNDDQLPLVSGGLYDQRSDDVDGGCGSAWSSRAGSFVAGKMSFFEESRAFIDKYLGRWNQEHASNAAAAGSEPDEQLDECTSGATSGEEIWGTPTSGGDNDELPLVNSENTHSSPTKSSTSLNDDDDTELMMDELLMAPPMTASTIRGLLPRRRLEPLFEEETESDEEEKTQQESDELKKGEATTNGHDSADTGGSSSGEDEDLETGTNQDEDEETSSTEERLQPNLPTTPLGPRPLRSPGAGIPLPTTVIRGSSYEYQLERRSVSLTASSCSSRSPAAIASSSADGTQQQALRQTQLIVTEQATTIQTSSTTMTMTHRLLATRRTPPSTSTTTSSVPATTNNSGECGNSTAATGAATTVASSKRPTSTTAATSRPARFIPPPPPPRRLLLTQTNLKTSGNASTAVPQRSSGGSADAGSSGAVVAGDATHKRDSPIQRPAMSLNRASDRPTPSTITRAAFSIRNSVSGTVPEPKRPSSTIIETSLLGLASRGPASTSSTTASTTKTDQQTTKTGSSSQEEDSTSDATQPPAGSGLSPRLEMRLALNHDILGDEDLICYDPGPDLTTILGHDLSTFHRLTGRDLLHRSATNRVQPREAVISFSQQRNSKMDTPTVNRRPRPCPSPSISSSSLRAASGRGSSCHSNSNIGSGGCVAPLQSLLRPNRNTWSSSASADRNVDGSASGAVSCKSSYSSDESKLSDLEILARREKIYCMSQSRSGSPAMRTPSAARVATTRGSSSCDPTQPQQQQRERQWHPQAMTTTKNTTSKGQETERETVGGSGSMRVRKVGRDETSLMETGKGNRLINFIKRRNSEVPLSPDYSQSSLHESNASSTPERRQVQMSPRKDNDKPSLNRRLWKQITKRRRANSVSEIVAN